MRAFDRPTKRASCRAFVSHDRTDSGCSPLCPRRRRPERRRYAVPRSRNEEQRRPSHPARQRQAQRRQPRDVAAAKSRLARPGRDATPACATISSSRPVVLVDSYPSIPGGLSMCQAGEERFLRVVASTGGKAEETFRLKVASCRENLELAAPALEWLRSHRRCAFTGCWDLPQGCPRCAPYE
jgi:hypothetical protein